LEDLYPNVHSEKSLDAKFIVCNRSIPINTWALRSNDSTTWLYQMNSVHYFHSDFHHITGGVWVENSDSFAASSLPKVVQSEPGNTDQSILTGADVAKHAHVNILQGLVQQRIVLAVVITLDVFMMIYHANSLKTDVQSLRARGKVPEQTRAKIRDIFEYASSITKTVELHNTYIEQSSENEDFYIGRNDSNSRHYEQEFVNGGCQSKPTDGQSVRFTNCSNLPVIQFSKSSGCKTRPSYKKLMRGFSKFIMMTNFIPVLVVTSFILLMLLMAVGWLKNSVYFSLWPDASLPLHCTDLLKDSLCSSPADVRVHCNEVRGEQLQDNLESQALMELQELRSLTNYIKNGNYMLLFHIWGILTSCLHCFADCISVQ